MTETQPRKTRSFDIVHRLCEWWALAGGTVLVGVVLVNAVSIVSDMAFSSPFPGDFEVTEVGMGIAAFSFLPYCQITGANVMADIFTAWAGRTLLAVMGIVAALAAMLFSTVLLWRMWDGLLDYQKYAEVTAILNFPIWAAFIPCLVSLALLCVASLMTFLDLLDQRKKV